jgi:hypothetical protein
VQFKMRLLHPGMVAGKQLPKLRSNRFVVEAIAPRGTARRADAASSRKVKLLTVPNGESKENQLRGGRLTERQSFHSDKVLGVRGLL